MELQQILRELLLVPPEQVPGLGVDREHLLLRRGDEHDAVVDDGWRLMPFVHAGGEGPHRHQLLDVGGGDLIEGTVAPAAVVAPVHQPVVRLRIEEPLLGHRGVASGTLRRQQGGPQRHHHCGTEDGQLSCRHRRRLPLLTCAASCGIAAWTAHPPPDSKPGRPMKTPATAGMPSTIVSGRAGSRRGAGPFRTRAPSLRSNSEKWHEHLTLLERRLPLPQRHSPCACTPPSRPRCRPRRARAYRRRARSDRGGRAGPG